MNYTKLNELAAKAMGWTIRKGPIISWWRGKNSEIMTGDWNPATCVDDAFILIDYIASIKSKSVWGISRGNIHPKYQVSICLGIYADSIWRAESDSAPLAITLCALRASGISESELTEAMKEAA